jgi:3-oxoadipate enol-lactonase
MPYAHLNHTAIYYEDHRDGQDAGLPLVLLHGAGADHGAWRPQLEAFKHDYRVIVLDLRGAGLSGRLFEWRGAIKAQADDVAALLEQLQVARAVLCGMGAGGVVALRFALDYPERCGGLVVADAFAASRGDGRREGVLHAANTAFLPLFYLPKDWLVASISRYYARWPLAQRELVRAAKHLRGPDTVRLRRALNGVDYLPELSGLSCPTLGIAGTGSASTVAQMERLVQLVPGARLKRIEEAIEPSNLCQPERFNAALGDFLRELSA